MQIGSINLYDPDIYKIPEYNWQKFQRCLLMDAGIGSNVGDLLKHADNIAIATVNERKEDLDNQLTNFKLSLYSTIEGITYSSMAFACLVKDIDNVTYSIVTDADINTLSKVIIETGITHGELTEYIELVKKKLILN